jgi:hypothetical protein
VTAFQMKPGGKSSRKSKRRQLVTLGVLVEISALLSVLTAGTKL